jgi:hypothetical protein
MINNIPVWFLFKDDPFAIDMEHFCLFVNFELLEVKHSSWIRFLLKIRKIFEREKQSESESESGERSVREQSEKQSECESGE